MNLKVKRNLIAGVFSSIQVFSGMALAGAPMRDLKIVLSDTSISNFFQANGITNFDSLEQGVTAACGPNSPIYYKLTVEQAGVWKPCTVTILVQAVDGNCMGQSQRKPRILTPLVCEK